MSAFAQESQIEQYDRVDSINALLGNLRKLYERAGPKKFVVVLEGIDRVKQPAPTLLPALARLGDQVCTSQERSGSVDSTDISSRYEAYLSS